MPVVPKVSSVIGGGCFRCHNHLIDPRLTTSCTVLAQVLELTATACRVIAYF